MPTTTYTVTGSMTDGRTVALDEEIPVCAGKVRVVVEPIGKPCHRPTFEEVLANIRSRQKRRGFQPPSAEQVDANLRAERENWRNGG